MLDAERPSFYDGKMFKLQTGLDLSGYFFISVKATKVYNISTIFLRNLTDRLVITSLSIAQSILFYQLLEFWYLKLILPINWKQKRKPFCSCEQGNSEIFYSAACISTSRSSGSILSPTETWVAFTVPETPLCTAISIFMAESTATTCAQNCELFLEQKNRIKVEKNLRELNTKYKCRKTGKRPSWLNCALRGDKAV